MREEEEQNERFDDALAHLQCILLALRVQADSGSMDLRWRHFDILAFIDRQGPCTPSAISDAFKMSRSSMSKHIKTLEVKGFISKIATGGDGRSHEIAITKQGRNVIHNILQAQSDNAFKAMQVLTPHEVNQFTVIAGKISQALFDEDLLGV